MSETTSSSTSEPQVDDFVITYRKERVDRRPVRGQIVVRQKRQVYVAYFFKYDNGGDVMQGFRTIKRNVEEVEVVPRQPGELSPYEKFDAALGIDRSKTRDKGAEDGS